MPGPDTPSAKVCSLCTVRRAKARSSSGCESRPATIAPAGRKTHVCRVPAQYFDFLGYQFGRLYSEATGNAYVGTRPSKKSVKRLIKAIHEQTTRKTSLLEADEVIATLNRKLLGWANYFKLGPVSKTYRAVDSYTKAWLRRWLQKKIRSVATDPAGIPTRISIRLWA